MKIPSLLPAALLAFAFVSRGATPPPARESATPPAPSLPENSPFLGALAEAIPPPERMAMGLAGAARVLTIVEGSPAAGTVRPGDLILAIGAEKVAGPEALLEICSKVAMGSQVKVLVRRDGKDLELALTTRPGCVLQTLDAQSARAVVDGVYVQMTFAKKSSDGSGSVTRQEESKQGFLGVALLDNPAGPEWDESGLPKGALVRDVVSGSAAERAGVQPGDVITWAKGRPVNSAAELTSTVSSLQPGTELQLVVQRNGTQVTLNVQLGGKPDLVPNTHNYGR